MIIAIDLDDVLTDSLENFIEYYNINYSKNMRVENFEGFRFSDFTDMSLEEEIELIEKYEKSELFKRIKPKRGSKDVIKRLSKDNRLIVVTSRPQKREKETREFVKKHFKEIVEVKFIRNDFKGKSKTKAEVCKEIGAKILIEDNLEYANECAKEGIRILLFDFPYNRKDGLSKLITRVYSWDDISSYFNL